MPIRKPRWKILVLFVAVAAIVAAGLYFVPRALLAEREAKLLAFVTRPGTPCSNMRFSKISPLRVSGRTQLLSLGRMALRLPRAWRVGPSTPDRNGGDGYWFVVTISPRSGGRHIRVRISFHRKLWPAYGHPWWRAGARMVKPLYRSPRHFFSLYKTPLAFDEAVAEVPDALPKPGSRLSIRRRLVLLLPKPEFGGPDVYETRAGHLTVIFSIRAAGGIAPGKSASGPTVGSPNNAQQSQAGGPALPPGFPPPRRRIWDCSGYARFYNAAGQLRNCIVLRFRGCTLPKATVLTREIIAGMSITPGPTSPQRKATSTAR